MKKTLIYFMAAICIFLTSCKSENTAETYFVHAAGFEDYKDQIKLTLLLEKHKEKEYFTVSETDSTLQKAVNKLMNKYKDCYFATTDIYFIGSEANSNFLSDISKTLCDSNIFPTTAEIAAIKDTSIESFMKKLKNNDDVRTLKKDSSKERINTIKFLSYYFSEKDISLSTFYLGNNKIKKANKTSFSIAADRRT